MSYTNSNYPKLGRLVCALDVEQAATDMLRKNIGVYLDAVGTRFGYTAPLVRPRSITCAPEVARYAEDQLPAIVVMSPGIVGNVERRGAGTYDAPFGLVVACAVSASKRYNALKLVRIWCAAIRACCVNHAGLDASGLTSSLAWIGEQYVAENAANRRTICAGTVEFRARVADVVDATVGPLDPTDPAAIWPSVQTHDEDVELISGSP